MPNSDKTTDSHGNKTSCEAMLKRNQHLTHAMLQKATTIPKQFQKMVLWAKIRNILFAY